MARYGSKDRRRGQPLIKALRVPAAAAAPEGADYAPTCGHCRTRLSRHDPLAQDTGYCSSECYEADPFGDPEGDEPTELEFDQ
jgi:hypothetical protein